MPDTTPGAVAPIPSDNAKEFFRLFDLLDRSAKLRLAERLRATSPDFARLADGIEEYVAKEAN